MEQYRIENGTKPGAIEIYFDGKPSAETRTALKSQKFHWNGKKLCWYGFTTPEKIAAIIKGVEQPAQLTEEAFKEEFFVNYSAGYMGATEATGSKSGFLCGAELSGAIRRDLKRWGIKGVSVRVKTYSGGQSLTITISEQPGDFLSLDEYRKEFYYEDGAPNYSKALELCRYNDLCYFEDGEKYGRRLFIADFDNMPDGEAKRDIFRRAIAHEYDSELNSDINGHQISKYKTFTEQFRNRFSKICRVVNAYNHDDTNSMVDYFDRNFYEDYTIKRIA